MTYGDTTPTATNQLRARFRQALEKASKNALSANATVELLVINAALWLGEQEDDRAVEEKTVKVLRDEVILDTADTIIEHAGLPE